LLRAGGQEERQAALREALPDMGRHLSEMERRAAEAERELVDWKKVRFMAGKLGERFSAYVTGVQAFGLFVELEEIYVQGLVHVSSMTDDYYRFNDKAHTLRGESGERTYRLGDRVEVQVARVDLERRQIELALVQILEHAALGGTGSRAKRRSAEAGGRARRGRRQRGGR
jgi:ribonuclease R